MLGQISVFPREDPTDSKNKDLRKRQKYIQRCKETAWKRQGNEYPTPLCERQFKAQQERTRG